MCELLTLERSENWVRLLGSVFKIKGTSGSGSSRRRRDARVVAGGMSEQEIPADFPDLTAEDLKPCLAFAADRERRLYRTHAA
jgi:hypothetical protein